MVGSPGGARTEVPPSIGLTVSIVDVSALQDSPITTAMVSSLNIWERLAVYLVSMSHITKSLGGGDTLPITFTKEHFSFHTIIFPKITTSQIRHYLTQCDVPSPVFQEVTKTANN